MSTDVDFFCFTVVLFCLAFRTPTGGQSSESTDLSGAPLLSSPADSGDFHTHVNEWVGLREKERQSDRG